MRLTKEQRALVERHHKLIYSFLVKHQLPVDAYYGECAEGLCKAAAAYEEGKGAFSTLAYRYMFTEMSHALRRDRRQQSITKKLLDRPAPGPIDLTKAEAQELTTVLLVALPERKRQILALLLQGHSQRAISDELGVSRQAVSRNVKRIRETYEEMTK